MASPRLPEEQTTDSEQPLPPLGVRHEAARGPWRAVCLGLVLVAAIAVLTPFNNFLVENTYLIGGTMPFSVTLVALLLAAVLNPIVIRLSPARALSRSELGIVLLMLLVGCALPGIGFVATVPYALMGTLDQAGRDVQIAQLLQRLAIPSWVFPATTGDATDPVVVGFVSRAPDAASGWWAAVPWAAWVKPALAWGVFAMLLIGLFVFGALVVLRQWAQNERLPFPIASIYTALIEPPQPGRLLNRLLLARPFWIAVAAVIVLRALNGLNLYNPSVPTIPLGFDLRGMFTESFVRFSDDMFRAAGIFFGVIGIAFFLQSKIAFSLWACYAAMQITQAVIASNGGEITSGVKQDQTFGAMLAVVMLGVWLGRQHYASVLKQMFRGHRPGDPESGFISYRAAGWGLVLCAVGLVLWLTLAGTSATGAVIIVALLSLILLVIARVAAETGLPFIQMGILPHRVWFYGSEIGLGATSSRTFFWTAFCGVTLAHDTREAGSIYALHGLKLADENPGGGSRRRTLVVAAFMAAAVSLVVSGAAMLLMEYHHASSLSVRQSTPLNPYGLENAPKNHILGPSLSYDNSPVDRETHSHLAHVGAGAGVTGALGALRARFTAWPIHPLGFLLVYTFPLGRLWFSVLLGWLAKVTIVRLGGARLLQASTPFFIGLVAGESLAAVLWLISNLTLAFLGIEYRSINFTP